MSIIVTALIAFTAFAGEIVFSAVLKNENCCSANGCELLKAVSPLAAVSAALWGPRYLFGSDDLLYSLAICFVLYAVMFLVELFIMKKRVPALFCIVFFIQSALAATALFDIHAADGIVKSAVLFGAAAIVPALANVSIAALKTKINSRKCGIVITCCACFAAPQAVSLAFVAVLNEVIVSVRAL